MTKWVANVRHARVEELEDDETFGFDQFTPGHSTKEAALTELKDQLNLNLARAEKEVKKIRNFIQNLEL